MPDLVGDPLLLQLLLGRPDRRDLGNGIDPVGLERRDTGLVGDFKGVARGDAALLHRGRGERGKADDVSGGVDIRHRRLEMLVDGKPPARVRLQARGRDAGDRRERPADDDADLGFGHVEEPAAVSTSQI